MNLKGLLHSESRVVLGLSRKQSIQENSGDANNDKHSLHRLPPGKGKHIKTTLQYYFIFQQGTCLTWLQVEKRNKRKKLDQSSRFPSKSFVKKGKNDQLSRFPSKSFVDIVAKNSTHSSTSPLAQPPLQLRPPSAFSILVITFWEI